jgi:hypothetical protein
MIRDLMRLIRRALNIKPSEKSIYREIKEMTSGVCGTGESLYGHLYDDYNEAEAGQRFNEYLRKRAIERLI